jgi:hypothetical protein
MKPGGMLQGSGGISVSIGKPGEGNSGGEIVLRIKADALGAQPR